MKNNLIIVIIGVVILSSLFYSSALASSMREEPEARNITLERKDAICSMVRSLAEVNNCNVSEPMIQENVTIDLILPQLYTLHDTIEKKCSLNEDTLDEIASQKWDPIYFVIAFLGGLSFGVIGIIVSKSIIQ